MEGGRGGYGGEGNIEDILKTSFSPGVRTYGQKVTSNWYCLRRRYFTRELRMLLLWLDFMVSCASTCRYRSQVVSLSVLCLLDVSVAVVVVVLIEVVK